MNGWKWWFKNLHESKGSGETVGYGTAHFWLRRDFTPMLSTPAHLMPHLFVSPLPGTKALPAEDGRNEEESGQGQPAWGAIAAEPEREKELNGESHSAAGTSGPVDDDINKKDGDTKGDQGSEQQPQELIPDRVDGKRVPSVPIPDGGERVQSMPRQVPRRRLRHRFTQWQLEELERIFQTNGSLGVQAR